MKYQNLSVPAMMVLTKMREQKIKNLTDDELQRVFANTIAPIICMRIAKRMIADGLTVDEIYNGDV